MSPLAALAVATSAAFPLLLRCFNASFMPEVSCLSTLTAWAVTPSAASVNPGRVAETALIEKTKSGVRKQDIVTDSNE